MPNLDKPSSRGIVTTPPSSGQVLRFGAFEVNLGSRELRKHGIRIKLQGQSFSVLACLLEKPGAVVTRDELCRRIWPESTHVDFDNSLNTMIRHVREALGDSAKNPRFVDTVPRRGYRFVAPVAPVATESGAVGKQGRSPWVYLIPAAAVLAVVLASWFFRSSLSTGEVAVVPRLSPLTSSAGIEGHPSFSPDGSRIAFHWNGTEQDEFDIYVKGVDIGEPSRLTNDSADDLNPSWSPDGSQIAFLRRRPNNQWAVMVIPATGGEERQIATIPDTESGLAWFPNGEWIAYSVSLPDYVRHASDQSGILAVSVETGQSIRITAPKTPYSGDIDPAFSPDGRRLAFIRISSYAVGELYLADIGPDLIVKGQPRRLTFDAADSSSPAWTPDGMGIIFVSSRSGYRSVWKMRASGRGEPILLGGEDVHAPAVAPAGDRIAYARSDIGYNLWELDLDKPVGEHNQPRQLTHSTKAETNIAYSPDGRRVAFQSNRSGSGEIWVCASDGTNRKRLTFFRGPSTGTPRWSPDGEFLVFDSRVRGQGEIFVISSAGGSPRQVTTNPADDIVPSWSRDGKWIYFASNRTGSFQVWKAPAAGGNATQVTHGGGAHTEESPDGKFLYYTKSLAQTELCRMPVEGGKETVLFGPLDYWANFSVARDGVYFMTESGRKRYDLRFFDLKTGETGTITTIDSPSEGLSVSPDERKLIFAKSGAKQGDLVLMTLE